MLIQAVVAFGLALALSPMALLALRRLGVMDVPSDRSSHVQPTPRGGGVAVGIAATTALLTASSMSDRPAAGVLVAACAFGVVGLFDDVLNVPALLRLACQAVTAAGVVPWLVDSSSERSVMVLIGVGFLTGFWLVSYVNAYNFMDGINGIAVVQVAVAGCAWVVVAGVRDLPMLSTASVVIVAAALGFAPYNFPRARLFLGDTGSYFIGAWVAAVAVLGVRAGVPLEAMLAPLSLCLADTGTTLLRRVLRGDTWYAAHRDHAYQRLVGLGWSHEATTSVVALLLVTISALGLVSLTGSVWLRVVGDLVATALLAVYLWAPDWLAGRA